MPVFFHNNFNGFQLKAKRRLKQWVRLVVETNDKVLGAVNFVFCTDEYLKSINSQYLKHNYYTDVITFDLSDEDKSVQGDILISVERVKENARELKVRYEVELRRVMIHGVLHLLGKDDKTKSQAAEMRKLEDKFLVWFEDVSRET